MLSSNKIKFIKSLNQKKNREYNNCFIVEGEKIILELINSNFNIIEILSTKDFIDNHKINNNITQITEYELQKISNLKTPNKAVAIVKIPNKSFNNNIFNNLNIILDNIQDPGNLGTIIRTADWFGINNIFCSTNTVDVFNHKVIQSTMGAIFRVNIFYTDILKLIQDAIDNKQKIYGALLSGKNIYNTKLENSGLIILGNESKGISKPIQDLISDKIKIPNYPENNNNMESLNVSIANAIILAEFRRQQHHIDI